MATKVDTYGRRRLRTSMSTQVSQAFDPYHRWLGIPPKDQPPHHYRLLGIEAFEEDADVIESAADRQMKHVRSFQTGSRSRFSQQLLNEFQAKLDLHQSYSKRLLAIRLISSRSSAVMG
jgi:hypothetical protein